MAAKITETLHEAAVGLDCRPLSEVSEILAEGQIAASVAVRQVVEDIAAASRAMAQTIRSGGRLHYAAAGSSGLMAAADAQELGGTFSIPASQLCIHVAGGLPTGVEMPGATEDDTQGLDVALATLTAKDTAIVVSASGTTPFALAAADIAASHGATLIGIANNRDAPLLQRVDHPILLETPPEVLSGSTRMGAGTAQKIALNMLSTLMAVDLGHVHDGMMVNVQADNAKLRARAQGIVTAIANVSADTARAALDDTQGHVKSAILVAARGLTHSAALSLLAETDGQLRPALDRTV